MNNIRYVEYDATHTHDFVFDIPEGHDCWLLIVTQTPATFLVDGEYREYPANCAVLYRPNQRIYYRACQESYANDWIRFDTDEHYVTMTPITCGIPFIIHDPAYCHKIFQLIFSEDVLSNTYKEINIDNLLRILFNKLLESFDHHPVSPLYRSLTELKKSIYRQPNLNWTVAMMADRLNISAGHLQAIYKETFGISCIEDVIHSRIELAKKYLLYDHYSTVEIASLCGYHNVEHFFRQFKKMVGMSPTVFRKTPYQPYIKSHEVN